MAFVLYARSDEPLLYNYLLSSWREMVVYLQLYVATASSAYAIAPLLVSAGLIDEQSS